MSDGEGGRKPLVERLRVYASGMVQAESSRGGALMLEAADEIVRLRARVAELEDDAKRFDTVQATQRILGRDDERTDIVTWLRTVFAQNRNAQGFADAIEKGEQHAAR